MTYYDAKQVVRRGIKIQSLGIGKKPQSREDEVLVGVMDNDLWVIAPNVTSVREFDEFHT